MNVLLRGVNWMMCALFLLSILVQWNDPDPARWIAIYGAALGICLVVAFRGGIQRAAPLLVMVVAVAWSLATLAGGPAANAYSHMFDAWEMKSMPIEEAREAIGLLIVAAWMLVVARFATSGRQATRPSRIC